MRFESSAWAFQDSKAGGVCFFFLGQGGEGPFSFLDLFVLGGGRQKARKRVFADGGGSARWKKRMKFSQHPSSSRSSVGMQ